MSNPLHDFTAALDAQLRRELERRQIPDLRPPVPEMCGATLDNNDLCRLPWCHDGRHVYTSVIKKP